MKNRPSAVITGLSLLYCLASGTAGATPGRKGWPSHDFDSAAAQKKSSGTVWDEKLNWAQRMALKDYHNIKALFQVMPYNPGDPDLRETGWKLTEALTDRSGLIPCVNKPFARRMDAALAKAATRDRLVRLADENPAGLNAAMDDILADPAHASARVRAIPLPSEHKAQPAPARTGT